MPKTTAEANALSRLPLDHLTAFSPDGFYYAPTNSVRDSVSADQSQRFRMYPSGFGDTPAHPMRQFPVRPPLVGGISYANSLQDNALFGPVGILESGGESTLHGSTGYANTLGYAYPAGHVASSQNDGAPPLVTAIGRPNYFQPTAANQGLAPVASSGQQMGQLRPQQQLQGQVQGQRQGQVQGQGQGQGKGQMNQVQQQQLSTVQTQEPLQTTYQGIYQRPDQQEERQQQLQQSQPAIWTDQSQLQPRSANNPMKHWAGAQERVQGRISPQAPLGASSSPMQSGPIPRGIPKMTPGGRMGAAPPRPGELEWRPHLVSESKIRNFLPPPVSGPLKPVDTSYVLRSDHQGSDLTNQGGQGSFYYGPDGHRVPGAVVHYMNEGEEGNASSESNGNGRRGKAKWVDPETRFLSATDPPEFRWTRPEPTTGKDSIIDDIGSSRFPEPNPAIARDRHEEASSASPRLHVNSKEEIAHIAGSPDDTLLGVDEDAEQNISPADMKRSEESLLGEMHGLDHAVAGMEARLRALE